MNREDAREIVWQEANQLALARRELPALRRLANEADLILIAASTVEAPAMSDALDAFIDALQAATRRLDAAVREVEEA